MNKNRCVTDHEFKRMEQWLTLIVSDEARRRDRERRLEFDEKIRKLGEVRRKNEEMRNKMEEDLLKRNDLNT